jgi:hypothetical protein
VARPVTAAAQTAAPSARRVRNFDFMWTSRVERALVSAG